MSNQPKKSLGQHWLNDPASLRSITDLAELNSQDVVLEIGPGQGSLTTYLTALAQKVVAVELDRSLALTLPTKVRAKNLEVINQDILTFNLASLPAGYKLVANIPYYLSGNLIKVLSEATNPPTTAVLLVQKEVAERVADGPPRASILSNTAQYFWEVSLGPVITKDRFIPPPKVDSQVMVLKRRVVPLFSGIDEAKFFKLVKTGFSQKRKTLLNNLSGKFGLSREGMLELLQKSSIEPTRRAQTLGLADWHRLYLSLNT